MKTITIRNQETYKRNQIKAYKATVRVWDSYGNDNIYTTLTSSPTALDDELYKVYSIISKVDILSVYRVH